MKKKKEMCTLIHTYEGAFDAQSHSPVNSAPGTPTRNMGCHLCHCLCYCHLYLSTLPMHVCIDLFVVGGEKVGWVS